MPPGETPLELPSSKTWRGILKPIVARLDLCAKLDLDLVEKPDGCAAMSSLFKTMAGIIDDEIVRRGGGTPTGTT